MCQKVTYETKQQAVEDANFIKHQARHFSKKQQGHHKHGKKLSAYYCKRCGGWHLTTEKQKRKY